MFTEILKIVPRIDRAALAVMESTLTKRFLRVAGQFGKGLEKVMKGNLLFLSVGFVAQLLNPLEKVHDKIKELLGEGFDIEEIADRFNTAPGTIKRMQAFGQSLGLDPSRLNELMGKFAEAIEKARDELANPTVEPSRGTQALRQFVDEEDLGKSFFQFIRSLQAQGKDPGTVEINRQTGNPVRPEERDRLERQGLIERQTGLDIRRAIEKEIFGDVQHGAARKLIESDFARVFERLGLKAGHIEKPGSPDWEGNDTIEIGVPNKLDTALENLIKLAEQQRVRSTRNQLNDFIQSSGMITENVVKGVEDADERERAADRRNLSNAETLQRASKNLDEITKLLSTVSNKVLEGVGLLATFIPQLLTRLDGLREMFLKFTDSRFLRGIFK